MYIHIYMYTDIHICTFTYIHTYVQVYKYAYVYTHTYLKLFLHIYICGYCCIKLYIRYKHFVVDQENMFSAKEKTKAWTHCLSSLSTCYIQVNLFINTNLWLELRVSLKV